MPKELSRGAASQQPSSLAWHIKRQPFPPLTDPIKRTSCCTYTMMLQCGPGTVSSPGSRQMFWNYRPSPTPSSSIHGPPSCPAAARLWLCCCGSIHCRSLAPPHTALSLGYSSLPQNFNVLLRNSEWQKPYYDSIQAYFCSVSCLSRFPLSKLSRKKSVCLAAGCTLCGFQRNIYRRLGCVKTR